MNDGNKAKVWYTELLKQKIGARVQVKGKVEVKRNIPCVWNDLSQQLYIVDPIYNYE